MWLKRSRPKIARSTGGERGTKSERSEAHVSPGGAKLGEGLLVWGATVGAPIDEDIIFHLQTRAIGCRRDSDELLLKDEGDVHTGSPMWRVRDRYIQSSGLHSVK